MNKYKVLNTQTFSSGSYSIIPIRIEDRYDIMKWRNQQMYHLRQSEKLTIEKQDYYFNKIITPLFDESRPKQILFSLLHKNKCIGYGGLVHLNWIDKNAEISFIMDTELEKNNFELIWNYYLKLIERVAFEDLNLHKISTYAFDLRPHLYPIFEKNNFFNDAILKHHCFFDNHYIDVVIHSKININENK